MVNCFLYCTFAAVINKGIMAKREYVEANKRWLEEKAKEEGVQVLP